MTVFSKQTRVKLWQGKLSDKSQKRLEVLPFKKLAFASLLISCATIVLVILLRKFLPPEVPLFYGRPKGEEQLATSFSLIIPSLVSFSILVLNSVVSLFLEDEFLRKALVLAGVSIVFFSTITTIKIFLLVGSF